MKVIRKHIVCLVGILFTMTVSLISGEANQVGDRQVAAEFEVWRRMIDGYVDATSGVNVEWVRSETRMPNDALADHLFKGEMERQSKNISDSERQRHEERASRNAEPYRKKTKTDSTGVIEFRSISDANANVIYTFENGATAVRQFFFYNAEKLMYKMSSAQNVQIRPNPQQHLFGACPVSPLFATIDRLDTIEDQGGLSDWDQSNGDGAEVISVSTSRGERIEFKCAEDTLIPFSIIHKNATGQMVYSYEVLELSAVPGFADKVRIKLFGKKGELKRSQDIEMVKFSKLDADHEIRKFKMGKGLSISDLTVDPPVNFSSDLFYDSKK